MDRYQAGALAMIVIGAAIVFVAQLGEHLGWWNDAGEWLTVLGLVLGGLGVGVTILLGATKGEVRLVRSEVHAVGDEVRIANGKLDQANGKLDQANGKLDAVVALLTQIRDRLAGG